METLNYTYSTPTEIQRVMRPADYVALADMTESGSADTNIVNDAIDEATDKINLFCLPIYNDYDMANNLWVRRRGTILACYYLSQERNNAAKFASRVEKILDELERIHRLELFIPRLPFRMNLDPACSNYIVDQRYQRNQIRVTPSNSTGGNYSQESMDNTDWGMLQF